MKKLTGLALVIIIFLSVFVSCHEEETSDGIKGVKFQEVSKSIFVGDVVTIPIKIEGTGNAVARYSTSREDIVRIVPGSGNNGVIIEGLNSGTVVITVIADKYTDYCNITVGGSNERLIPHILCPVTVIEVPVYERRSITVSLAGGTPLDNSGFIWSTNNSSIFSSFESTGGVCIFETTRKGEAVITVRHPRAQYGVNILVFVTENNEKPIYITSTSSVYDIKKENGPYQFKVQLLGPDINENYGFIYQVIEGSDVVQLQHSNTDTATVIPKKAGIAIIQVNHSRAFYSYEVQVVVSEDLEYSYIELDKSLILMNLNEQDVVIATFNGDAGDDINTKYTYELTNQEIVSVTQSQGAFFVKALKEGKTILKINNIYADFAREVLIVVSDVKNTVLDNEKYITTSQNVITMEAGSSDAVLEMTLVGGNEGDSNSFHWYVDDSSVIKVEAADGKDNVHYDTMPAGRKMIEGAVYQTYTARAVISAKKAGTAKIVVQHPKAKNDSVVLVKVYPKNTFGSVPVVLSGQYYYLLPIGEAKDIKLGIQSGSEYDLGDVTWSCDDPETAYVDGSGTNGVIRAKKKGISNLVVSGGNLKNPFRALMVCASREELEEEGFIYVMTPYLSMVPGQSVILPIMSVNLKNEVFDNLKYVNSNSQVAGVSIQARTVGITAREKGESEIIISGEGTLTGVNEEDIINYKLNDLKIVINVEDEKVNLDYPYHLSSEYEITGIVKNTEKNITVTLVGGEKSENAIIWKSEDEGIVKVTGSGKSARIRGIKEGQTVIRVTHPKSKNELRLVIYVVTREEDLTGKVLLHLEKNNYLMEIGEDIVLSLITNANEGQKEGIEWSIDNLEKISLKTSDDRAMAFITAREAGIAQITVKHRDNVKSQVIYVSVVNRKNGIKYIGVPSVIEGVKGNNLNIQAVTENVSSYEIQGISWSIEDSNIASIAPNGLNCLVQPKNNGNTTIILKQGEMGIEKKILLYIYSSYEEMAASYIIGAQSGYINMMKGETVETSLVFGANGFPEYELNNIRWSVTSNNNVITVNGNGKKATIRAVSEGIGYIKVESNAAKNGSVIIEVEVKEVKEAVEGYWIEIKEADKVKGIVKGNYEEITVKLFNGLNEITTGLNDMRFEVSDNNIISIIQNDNWVRINAIGVGTSYVEVSHPSAGYGKKEKIFIYTANDADSLKQVYPVFFEKSNYLIKKGSIERILIGTKDGDPAKLAEVSVSLGNNNGSITASKITGEIIVNANNKGNEVIIVSFKGSEVARIYVSVTTTLDSDLQTFMVTENIIGLLTGQEYETKIMTNLPDYLNDSIIWKAEESAEYGEIISLLNGSGRENTITGLARGRTYINIQCNNVERKMLVVVCDTETELRNMRAINIEQRYFVTETDKTLNINIFNRKGNIEGNTVYSSFYNSADEYLNIIEVIESGNKNILLKGKSEGVACIRVKNDYYNFNELVYVEVRKAEQGNASNITNSSYITSSQTLYYMDDKEEKDVYVTVIGSGFYEWNYFQWYGYDSEIINLNYENGSAKIKGKKKGQTKVYISNPYCENILEIMFIIGDRFVMENTGEPYIYIEKTLFEFNKNDPKETIYYELRNTNENQVNNISFTESNNGVVKLDYSSKGKINVTPVIVGMASVRIENKVLDIYTDVYFIVRDTKFEKSIYLTTSENYIIMGMNEVKNTDIRLIGYSEIDSTNFKWTIDNSSVAQVMGNGTRGQIYPVSEGTATITVTHPKTENFPLKIHLKVTKNTNEKAIYLTTAENVIETVVSNNLNYIYAQKIGGNILQRVCEWYVDDPSILSVSGNELTGMFIAKRAGIAKITVTNSETTNYPLQIIVIVREPSGSNLYIQSQYSLVKMKPNETNRRIEVGLVGGEDKDNNRFNWIIYGQNPTDVRVAQNMGNVINIITNGNQCNINALNEGTARIRVAHEKADIPFYITVYVSKNSEIEFPVKEKTMKAGTSEFLEIKTPNYENFTDKVFFSSDNPSVATIVGTSQTVLVTAHAEGIAIIKAWIGGVEKEAELYIKVKEDFDPNVTRVVTSRTSYSLNPRDNPIQLEAYLVGNNVIDSDNDNIIWEIESNDMNYPLSIFPSSGRGRQIEVSPRREGKCIIRIRHEYVTQEYEKIIYVEVVEDQIPITLSKSYILVKGGKPESLQANIVGGRSSDYEKIIWQVTGKPSYYNGDFEEVIQIIGSGRQVLLYPKNIEYQVVVTAWFNGHSAECLVRVELDAMFLVETSSLKMYPGQTMDLKYILKPSNVNIQWYTSENQQVGGSEEPMITFQNLQGMQFLRITAMRPGDVTLYGIVSGGGGMGGGVQTIQIQIDYNYSIYFNMKPYIKFEPLNDKWNSGRTVVNFTVYPPNTTVEASWNGLDQMGGVQAELVQPKVVLKEGENELDAKARGAEGSIIINSRIEFSEHLIELQLKNTQNAPLQNKVIRLSVICCYDEPEQPSLYFMRYDGAWSNTEGGETPVFTNGYYSKGNHYDDEKYYESDLHLGEKLKKTNSLDENGWPVYELRVGDGENHYILFDKKYENSSFQGIEVSAPAGITNNKVLVRKEEVVMNNVKQEVIRIRGGKDGEDSILYNRVKYPKGFTFNMETNMPESGITKQIYDVPNHRYIQYAGLEFNKYTPYDGWRMHAYYQASEDGNIHYHHDWYDTAGGNPLALFFRIDGLQYTEACFIKDAVTTETEIFRVFATNYNLEEDIYFDDDGNLLEGLSIGEDDELIIENSIFEKLPDTATKMNTTVSNTLNPQKCVVSLKENYYDNGLKTKYNNFKLKDGINFTGSGTIFITTENPLFFICKVTGVRESVVIKLNGNIVSNDILTALPDSLVRMNPETVEGTDEEGNDIIIYCFASLREDYYDNGLKTRYKNYSINADLLPVIYQYEKEVVSNPVEIDYVVNGVKESAVYRVTTTGNRVWIKDGNGDNDGRLLGREFNFYGNGTYGIVYGRDSINSHNRYTSNINSMGSTGFYSPYLGRKPGSNSNSRNFFNRNIYPQAYSHYSWKTWSAWGGTKEHRDTDFYNHDVYIKLSIGETGKQEIFNIGEINKFPFKYTVNNSPWGAFSYWNTPYWEEGDYKGVPMPSISTGIVGKPETGYSYITYKVFDNYGNIQERKIVLKIIYEERDCHRNYKNDLNEVENETDWGKLRIEDWKGVFGDNHSWRMGIRGKEPYKNPND
jgi:hypothetical protein